MDQQVISENTVHEWTKIEPQNKNNVKPPQGPSGKVSISFDHLIVLEKNSVFTFHLKELYWSQVELAGKELSESRIFKPYFVRPGLIIIRRVSFKTVMGRLPMDLSLLTYETDQGVLKNFCQKDQKIDFVMPKDAKEESISYHADENYLYILASINAEDVIYQISLETLEVPFGRKITGGNLLCSSGSRERAFHDGKPYVVTSKSENPALWVLHFDGMKWEKIADLPSTKFASFVLENEPSMIVSNNEVLLYSTNKHLFATLSFDLNKSSWNDGFLILNTPQSDNLEKNTIQIAADENAFILFNNSDVYSLRNPDEAERSKREEIRDHMKSLDEGKREPDVIFKVEDQEFPVNKAILSYRSSYFKNMFSSNMMESHSEIIPIFDVRAKVFKAVLQYMYLEDFKIEDDIVEDLFKLSNEYNLKKLNRDCEKILTRNIEVENVINLTLFAERFEAEKLRRACLYFMAGNFEQISQAPNFKDLGETCTEVLNLSKDSANQDFKKRIIELSMIS